MIVYGVSANVSIAQLFIAGVLPGLLLASLFSGYVAAWSLIHPEQIPAATERTTFAQKVYASRHLIPVVLLSPSCSVRSTPASPPRPRRPPSASSGRW